MHIGMVHFSAGRFPPDIRVEKEIAALTRAGIRVSVLCPRVEDDPLEEELGPLAAVHRRRVRRPGRLRRTWENWTLVRREYKPLIEEFLETVRPDVLHVHDLDLVRTTLCVARPRSVPVIADLHENFPAAVVAWQAVHPWWFRLAYSLLVANRRALRWHELRCARQCERIIVVVPEAAERFLRAGVPPEKLVVVSNTEDESTMPCALREVDESLAAEFADRWVASYVGGGGAHRGVDTAIRAVAEIAREVPGFLLLLVGIQGRARERAERLVAGCGVQPSVRVLGWEPFEKSLEYILLSKVCLVPHNDFEHTQTTVPHKLFQYMVCQRPVVVSGCRPLKRIVEAAGAGLVFKANDPHDLANAVIRLAGDDRLRRECAASGRQAALTQFAWKHDAAALVAMYEAIARDRGIRRDGASRPAAATPPRSADGVGPR